MNSSESRQEGEREELKWGEKVINYVMRQANEIYYGSQAQKLELYVHISIKCVCLNVCI